MTRYDKLVATQSVIGKNVTSNFGKDIARDLGLPTPEMYTGHWIRRQTCSMMANAGCTLSEIKSVSKHKSDRTVQGYIDSAIPMKIKASESVALAGVKRIVHSSDDNDDDASDNKKLRATTILHIHGIITCTNFNTSQLPFPQLPSAE